MADVDLAYYLVHSMGSGPNLARKDREAARNFVEAVAEAGIQRIIYLGGLLPQGKASEHLASRRDTGDVLREGAVPVTEIRAGIVVGAGSAGFEVIRDLVNHLPVMTTPRWVQSRTQPIALDDLLTYLVRAAELPEMEGLTYDVAGPETLHYADLIEQCADVLGKHPVIVPLPFLTPRLSAYWLDLVTAVPASVAAPLIDSLSYDLLADDRAIRQLIPLDRLTYRDAVREALRGEKSAPLLARWTEGALVFRDFNPDYAFYSKVGRVVLEVDAPAEVVWGQVSSIGGDCGYRYADWAWRLRGLLDRLVGGVGMRRGRRHPTDVRIGDAIDFWRVAGLEEGRRLTLLAEMRLPGTAVLEFEVEPRSERSSRLSMAARFHPAGAPGLLYWYLLKPAHDRIFEGMPRALARAAERRAQEGRASH